MPIEFQCPRCSAAIQVPDAAAGKKGRCPQCQGKLRVPTPPPPPLMAIEFQCPRCMAAIRVPGEAAGKKGRCPQCNGKLRVPLVTAPPPVAAQQTAAAFSSTPTSAVANTSPPVVDVGENSVPALDGVQIGTTDATTIAKAVKRRRKSNAGALVVPGMFLAILAGVGVWFFWKPAPKLEGSLSAVRLEDSELHPVLIPPEALKLSKSGLRVLANYLETNPLRLKSSLMTVEFRGTQAGSDVVLSTGSDTVFFRVDPRDSKLLAKFAADHFEELDAPRRKELAAAAPQWVRAIEKLRKGQTTEALGDYRNSVGLTTLVRGLGYNVQAMHGSDPHRCVYEDAEGRLYFLLPATTRTFEIVGRPLSAKEPPLFPGRYVVTVEKSKTAKPKRDESDTTVHEMPSLSTEPPTKE